MNRLTRDEIIQRALRLADVPALDAHDRPGGVLVPGAYAIEWLQMGLDHAHNLFPESGLIKSQILTIVAGTDTYALASDFVQDFRDGILIQGTGVGGRLRSWSKQEDLEERARTLTNPTALREHPRRYHIEKPNVILFPVPKLDLTGTLYYYSMPNILSTPGMIPTFPSDLVLIQFLVICCKAWNREETWDKPLAYLTAAIGQLQSAGLGNEADRSGRAPMSPNVFLTQRLLDPNEWMGDTVVHP